MGAYENHLAASRNWKRAHRDQNNAIKRASYHRTKVLKPLRTKKTPEEYRLAGLESQKRYREAHPDYHRERMRIRRMRVIGSRSIHSLTQWREKCDLFANLCAYCGEAKPLTRDHNVPLTRGGTDDISNVVPACLSCNSRKGARTAAEFLS